jgi:hypothetical protein
MTSVTEQAYAPDHSDNGMVAHRVALTVRVAVIAPLAVIALDVNRA